MSDTPLTDALIDELCPYLESNISMRLEEHARQLELALAAKTAECERLREDAENYTRLRAAILSRRNGAKTLAKYERILPAIDAARKETP